MKNFNAIKNCPNCEGEGLVITMGGTMHRCNCEEHIEKELKMIGDILKEIDEVYLLVSEHFGKKGTKILEAIEDLQCMIEEQGNNELSEK